MILLRMANFTISTIDPSFRRLLLIKNGCTVFEPVALASEFNDFALVEQPVKQRRRKNFVAKHLCPLFRAFIGRNDE